MIMGLVLLVFEALVILAGTRKSEAILLYYDVEHNSTGAYSEEYEQDISEMSAVDDESESPVSMPVIPQEQPKASKVTVTVGGAAVNKGTRSGAVEAFDEIKAATKANDPNRTAQSSFDDLKGGLL